MILAIPLLLITLAIVALAALVHAIKVVIDEHRKLKNSQR